MRKFLISFILISVLISVFSACRPSAPAETSEPNQVLEATMPQATVTQMPTETTAPTGTPTREAPTPTETVTLGPSPTPDIANYRREVVQSLSPDETIAARVLTAFPISPEDENLEGNYFVRVWVVDLETGETSLVEEGWRGSGLGQTHPAVLGWTGDSKNLFIGDVGVPDGCGPAFTLDVRRYDLESGELTPLNLSNFGALSISPSGTQALIFSEGEVRVVDLMNMAEQRVQFEAPDVEHWVGDPLWSPGREQVLFRLKLNPCGPAEEMRTWLVAVNLAGSSSRVILQDDPRDLRLVSWPLRGIAQMRDRDGEVYWLDLSTGEILDEPPAEIAGAITALENYFLALSEGRYADAVGYYSGSYEVLIQMNPDVDPENRAALLEAGCTTNGFVCLPTLYTTLITQSGTEGFEFRVIFDQNGAPFERGPCCGSSLEEMPPQREFSYIVQRDQAGDWRVTDLPVYIP